MSKGAVAGIVGSLLVIGLISNACSSDTTPSAASSPPVTVRSVETFADFTLSNGRQVHSTMLDTVASSVIANTATRDCVTAQLNTFAQSNVLGRSVSDVRGPSPYYPFVTPVTGHERVALYFTNWIVSNDDGSMPYDDAWQAANSSCSYTSPVAAPVYTPAPTTTEPEPAPTTTSEAPVTAEPDVDRPYVPAPQTRVHTGRSGHPCLPGERDGDHDGYCGEGK